MPEFKTPEPISAVIDISMGDVRIVASDRPDTVVEVRPSDPAKRADVSAAEQTRVEYAAGRLLVKTARRWKSYSPFSSGASVEVQVALPSGSQVTGEASVSTFRCAGTLGACRLKTAVGDLEVEHAAAAELTTSVGDITLERATGNAELSTGSGEVRAGEIDGAAIVKNSNGPTRIGEVGGELRVKAANGDIAVEHALASLIAKTANGDISVGAARRGSVVAETGLGTVTIGIPDGTAAWLDLRTGFGRLSNSLDAAGPPEPGEDAVEVRARSGYGDITVRRRYPDAAVESASDTTERRP